MGCLPWSSQKRELPPARGRDRGGRQGLRRLQQRLQGGAGIGNAVLALLLQLGRLEELVRERGERREALAIAVQGSVHLLALGGYALPLQSCCRTGAPLEPPLGDRRWHCSLLPGEGLALGALAGARLVLWSSELALLQRLPRPGLPLRPGGELMGPEPVWLHLLELIEAWSGDHLGRSPRAFRLLRSGSASMPPSSPPLR